MGERQDQLSRATWQRVKDGHRPGIGWRTKKSRPEEGSPRNDHLSHGHFSGTFLRPARSVGGPILEAAISYEMGRAGGSCEATRSPLGGKPTPGEPMPAVADGVAPDNCVDLLAQEAEVPMFRLPECFSFGSRE
jgi:hypothetical protein